MKKEPEKRLTQSRENEISGTIELWEIAKILENGSRETTKCCATGTCD